MSEQPCCAATAVICVGVGGSANERKSGYSGVRPPCQQLASESTTVNAHQVTGNAGAEERSLEFGGPYLIRFCRRCLCSLRTPAAGRKTRISLKLIGRRQEGGGFTTRATDRRASENYLRKQITVHFLLRALFMSSFCFSPPSCVPALEEKLR